MTLRSGTLSACCVGLLCSLSCLARAQEEKSLEVSDRITPIVKVVQKCQGSVVAFIDPNTGKPRGTGVIVDAKGLIVTNAHVAGKATTYKIQLVDKTEFEGTVLKVVGDLDLAVVKINPATRKLDVLPPCKSDKVYVGEEVIAIGHPFGYSYSITRGILSATGRAITTPSGGVVPDAYQVDVALNPGNSGGPLMNINGELIGINFAMRDGAENIGFTIPAKRVREVLVSFSN